MSEQTPVLPDAVVAVGLLTAEELRNVGTGLRHIYPVPCDSSFDDLLKAVDRVSRGQSGSILKFPARLRGI